jgi:hypothetical protein
MFFKSYGGLLVDRWARSCDRYPSETIEIATRLPCILSGLRCFPLLTLVFYGSLELILASLCCGRDDVWRVEG